MHVVGSAAVGIAPIADVVVAAAQACCPLSRSIGILDDAPVAVRASQNSRLIDLALFAVGGIVAE